MTTLTSTITCPVCGHRKTETMPEDACQYFYDCENCKTVLKPKPGDWPASSPMVIHRVDSSPRPRTYQVSFR